MSVWRKMSAKDACQKNATVWILRPKFMQGSYSNRQTLVFPCFRKINVGVGIGEGPLLGVSRADSWPIYIKDASGKHGTPLTDVIADLDLGTLHPLRDAWLQLNVIHWPGQELFSVDNRRLYCLRPLTVLFSRFAHSAGSQPPFVVAMHGQRLTDAMMHAWCK